MKSPKYGATDYPNNERISQSKLLSPHPLLKISLIRRLCVQTLVNGVHHLTHLAPAPEIRVVVAVGLSGL